MKYVRNSTLLPVVSEVIRSLPRVPWLRLPGADLLLYDAGVSDFFFEFEPEEEIERFLLHAHFARRTDGGMLTSREDVHAITASSGSGMGPLPEVVLPPGRGELPAPLRFVPDQAALETIRREGRWRGRVTCCSCGIAGCFSQYAWVEQRTCLFLFTINGATLAEVESFPFRFTTWTDRAGARGTAR